MKSLLLPNHKRISVVDKFTARDIYKEIFEENSYLREGLQVKPGDVVVDIGGNVGLFSLYILEQVPQIRLVTIEPIPQIFAALEANLKAYQPPEAFVTLLNVGLAEAERDAEFEFYPRVPSDSTMIPFDFAQQVQFLATKYDHGIGRIIPRKWRAWIAAKLLRWAYTPVKVKCHLKTLSQLIAELNLASLDLVKLDAENADREVIAGIADKDWDKIRQMSIEVHTNIPGGQNLVEELTQLLKSKGFSIAVDRNSRFSYVGSHMLYAKR